MEGLLAATENDNASNDGDLSPSKTAASLSPAVDSEATTGSDTAQTSPSAEAAPVETGSVVIRIAEYSIQNQRMVYRLETTTNLSNFPKQLMVASRRYEDFQWLHTGLLANRTLTSVMVPKLPERISMATDSKVPAPGTESFGWTNDFAKRAKQLERFLNRISRHPKIQQDIHFVTFVAGTEQELVSPSSLNVMSLFSRSPDPKSDAEADLMALHTSALRYQKRVMACMEALGKMLRSRKVAADAMLALTTTFGMPDKRLEVDRDVFALSEFAATAAKRTAECEWKRLDVQDVFTAFLGDYKDISEGMTEALNRRLNLMLASQNAAKAVQKAKAALDSAKVANPEKIAQFESLKEEDKKALDALIDSTAEIRQEVVV